MCLVTGAGRGIGRGIALALAEEGGSVGLVARSEDQCGAVQEEIGENALALPTDVRDFAACQEAIAAVSARFGSPTVLINAAGVSPVRQRAEKHDVDAWHEITDVNLTGAYHMTRAAAPQLLDEGGAVVMVASTTALAASPRLAAYGASKAGLVQLSKTLAREWADRGVRVNAVCPGYVETDMSRELLSIERLRNEVLAETPLGRIGTIAEVVKPTLFLASDEASYVTGAVLAVDGGMAA